jgi:hypothetical protein
MLLLTTAFLPDRDVLVVGAPLPSKGRVPVSTHWPSMLGSGPEALADSLSAQLEVYTSAVGFLSLEVPLVQVCPEP